MKDFSKMTNEEFKEEFIQWFGEEVWEEQEILGFLDEVVFDICLNYLFCDPIPVIFEEVPGNISVFDNKLQCIKINPKYKEDKVTMVAALIHELEHYYQILYASNYDTPKARRWKKELQNYIAEGNPLGNILQEIEIDAEAFSQVILECEYGIKYKNPDPVYQLVIEEYIKSGKLLEE